MKTYTMFIGWKTQHRKYIQYYQHWSVGSVKSQSRSEHGGEMCEHMCVTGQAKRKMTKNKHENFEEDKVKGLTPFDSNI